MVLQSDVWGQHCAHCSFIQLNALKECSCKRRKLRSSKVEETLESVNTGLGKFVVMWDFYNQQWFVGDQRSVLAVQVPSRSGRSGNAIDGAFVYEVETLLLCHTVPKGVTVNSECCCKFLENHLGPVIRQKRPTLLARNPVCATQQRNVSYCKYSAATTLAVVRCWSAHSYSPDKSPFDYGLFRNNKDPLRRRLF